MSSNETMVACPRCGGYGGEPGENFGDYGWHPCYFCGTLGVVTQSQADADAIRAAEPVPYEPSGYDGEHRDEDDALDACPFCGDPDCDPVGDTHACDKARDDYEEFHTYLKGTPTPPPTIPMTSDEIPF